MAIVTKYKINTELPGWTTEKKLNMLAEKAAAVPENGTIVELGTFCGRSAYSLGSNKLDSVKLVCVDMFPDNFIQILAKDFPGIEHGFGNLDTPYTWQACSYALKDVVNLEYLRTVLPLPSFVQIDLEVDLLFIDTVHTAEGAQSDIDQWFPLLTDNAVVVFDDYCDVFPEYSEIIDKHLLTLDVQNREVYEHALWVQLGKKEENK